MVRTGFQQYTSIDDTDWDPKKMNLTALLNFLDMNPAEYTKCGEYITTWLKDHDILGKNLDTKLVKDELQKLKAAILFEFDGHFRDRDPDWADKAVLFLIQRQNSKYKRTAAGKARVASMGPDSESPEPRSRAARQIPSSSEISPPPSTAATKELTFEQQCSIVLETTLKSEGAVSRTMIIDVVDPSVSRSFLRIPGQVDFKLWLATIEEDLLIVRETYQITYTAEGSLSQQEIRMERHFRAALQTGIAQGKRTIHFEVEMKRISSGKVLLS